MKKQLFLLTMLLSFTGVWASEESNKTKQYNYSKSGDSVEDVQSNLQLSSNDKDNSNTVVPQKKLSESSLISSDVIQSEKSVFEDIDIDYVTQDQLDQFLSGKITFLIGTDEEIKKRPDAKSILNLITDQQEAIEGLENFRSNTIFAYKAIGATVIVGLGAVGFYALAKKMGWSLGGLLSTEE